MRLIALLLFFGMTVAGATPQQLAKARKKGAAHAAKRPSGSKLSTNVSFDDSVLRGQYQAPEEALAKVENEKGLKDLIGVRKHFKDRLMQASEQE